MNRTFSAEDLLSCEFLGRRPRLSMNAAPLALNKEWDATALFISVNSANSNQSLQRCPNLSMNPGLLG
jgi:hypothetical protein